MIRYYNFGERLGFSKTADAAIIPLLLEYVPDAKNITFTSISHNDEGIDCTITRELGSIVHVDLKVRSCDYGKDDLALETWSVCFTKVGWTRDYTKKTDYVLWYWVDSHKHYWVAFPPLRRVFSKYWQLWTYRKEPQDSGDWQSEVMFVPIAMIEREIAALATPKICLTPIVALGDEQRKPTRPCLVCGVTTWWWATNSYWGVKQWICGRCHPNPQVAAIPQ